MEILLLGLIGLAAGVLGGMFGIGGGILIVPCLVLLLGFGQKKAQGTSLVALLAPVGLLGVLNYYRANQADLRAGAIIGAAFFLGAFIGSKLVLNIDDTLVRKMFALFLALVSIYLFTRK